MLFRSLGLVAAGYDLGAQRNQSRPDLLAQAEAAAAAAGLDIDCTETEFNDYFGTHYERTCTTPSGGGGYSADLIALPNGGTLVAAEEQNRQGSYFTGYDSEGNFQYSGGATLTNPVNIAAGATAQPQVTAPIIQTQAQAASTSTNPAPQTQQAQTVQAGVVVDRKSVV